MKIILASQSPRRRELMELMGLQFSVSVSNTVEVTPPGISPAELVEQLALQKAQDVAGRFPDCCVVGSDTVVALDDGTILGKPRDADDAKRMITLLSGRTHAVYTGLALCAGERVCRTHDRTLVTVAPMSSEEIDWYVSTGEPMDKAGSYGIQGSFCRFVERIEGSYFTVIGLPVQILYRKLKEFGVL